MTLKLCLLLGFKRIVLLGIDFKMEYSEPYYKSSSQEFQKHYVDHNNNLYGTLSPLVKSIYKILQSGDSGYQTEIVSATKIDALPFIETINLKDELEKEIDFKR